jgi:hypothetical protein
MAVPNPIRKLSPGQKTIARMSIARKKTPEPTLIHRTGLLNIVVMAKGLASLSFQPE